jgi:hypothetical protein
MRLVVAERIEPRGRGRYQIDGRWHLSVRSAAEPVLRTGSNAELLVPIHFEDAQARIEVTYDW